MLVRVSKLKSNHENIKWVSVIGDMDFPEIDKELAIRYTDPKFPVHHVVHTTAVRSITLVKENTYEIVTQNSTYHIESMGPSLQPIYTTPNEKDAA